METWEKSARLREFIITNLVDLCGSISGNGIGFAILTPAVANKIITPTERAAIERQEDKDEKARMLFDCMANNPHNLSRFIEILFEVNMIGAAEIFSSFPLFHQKGTPNAVVNGNKNGPLVPNTPNRYAPFASILQVGSNGIQVTPDPLLDILKEIGDEKFMILTINGPKRMGKSFILSVLGAYYSSRIIGNWITELEENVEDYFTWKMGLSPETRGVNVLKKPIFVPMENGERYALILVDTQGEFDGTCDHGQMALIFAFSSIISSTFIYNLGYPVNSSHIDPLLTFIRTIETVFDQGSKIQEFQQFLLLCRNVPPMVYASGFYSKSNQPENSNTKAGNLFDLIFHSTGVAQAESLISHLGMFSSIGLFAICSPGEDVEGDSLRNVSERFKSVVVQLAELVVPRGSPVLNMDVSGHPISAVAYIPIFQEFARVMNQIRNPKIYDIFNSNLRIQLDSKLSKLVILFRDSIQLCFANSPNGFTKQELEYELQNFSNISHTEFDKFSCGNEDLRVEFKGRLQEEIEQTWSQYVEKNQVRVRAYHHEIRQEIQKQKSEIVVARNALCAIDFNNYLHRYKKPIKGHSGLARHKSTRELPWADFQSEKYSNDIEPLKRNIQCLEQKFRVTCDGLYEKIEFPRLDLDRVRMDFISFDFNLYYSDRAFEIHGWVKAFGEQIPPRNDICRVFDTLRYSNETTSMGDHLAVAETNYWQNVAEHFGYSNM